MWEIEITMALCIKRKITTHFAEACEIGSVSTTCGYLLSLCISHDRCICVYEPGFVFLMVFFCYSSCECCGPLPYHDMK